MAASDMSENSNVHAIMAKTLPKIVIIQSHQNDKYLHFDGKNPNVPDALRFAGDYSFDIDTRFELVPATTGDGLFHIRSLDNRKYWATNSRGPNKWIRAIVVEPEENKSDEQCTLFQPVFLYANNNRVLKLRHISSGCYVEPFCGFGSGSIYGSLSLTTSKNNYNACTFIDWESVVVLPNLIRIKGNNGNHLCAYVGGFMDFCFEADNSSLYDYEVIPSRDGGVRLKSVYYGTYWTDMDSNSWVWLQQASPTVHDTNTVFLPTIFGGKRIVMRCLKSELICRLWHQDGKESCLAAIDKYPEPWSYMEIEEPVLSRTIDNVRYHLTDARRNDEKNIALISNNVNNGTHEPIECELNLKTTVSNTTSWSTGASFKLGAKMSISFGVPLIGSGDIEISAEHTTSLDWGETKEEKLEVGSVRKITVPSMTRVKGTLMAARVSCDIPFSYTQRDILADGKTKVTEKKDGMFTCNKCYGFKYDVVELPLE